MSRQSHEETTFPDAVDEVLLDELSSPVSTGRDLTPSIMGRLGYMRVSPAEIRRRRIRRWLGRSGLLLVVLVAVGFGIQVHNGSPTARQPLSETIPAAIGHDVNQQKHRVTNAIQILRDLTPELELPIQATPAGETIESLDDFDEHDEEMLDPVIDRSAIAPVRWV